MTNQITEADRKRAREAIISGWYKCPRSSFVDQVAASLIDDGPYPGWSASGIVKTIASSRRSPPSPQQQEGE